MTMTSEPHRPTLSLHPVQGRWVNQMGSQVAIAVGSDGRLEGEFCGAAGALAGHPYPLVGMCQMRTAGAMTPLAFIVEWCEAGCVTAWCGEYLSDPVEEIRATWLMTSETAPGEEWRGTVTGHDVFRRA